MIATEEQAEKYKRMSNRLDELARINENIAKLAFYINEHDISNALFDTLKAQMRAMIQYRNLLQDRIIDGVY